MLNSIKKIFELMKILYSFWFFIYFFLLLLLLKLNFYFNTSQNYLVFLFNYLLAWDLLKL